jgi:hypothetical protein
VTSHLPKCYDKMQQVVLIGVIYNIRGLRKSKDAKVGRTKKVIPKILSSHHRRTKYAMSAIDLQTETLVRNSRCACRGSCDLHFRSGEKNNLKLEMLLVFASLTVFATTVRHKPPETYVTVTPNRYC